jgi:hypothetical protein
MSAGIRLSCEWALGAARVLFERWGMHPSACAIVGSVRRRLQEIGDLDIIAPLPPAGHGDPLYESIDATVIKPAAKAALWEMGGLEERFVEVKSGHNRYFKSLSVIAHLEADGITYPIPVQVSRYTPQNRGWMEIYKTGPREFGMWYLLRWKEHHGIPDHQAASVGNHLRTAAGEIVPLESENDCFRILSIAAVPPQDRAAYAAEGLRRYSKEQQERVS